MSVDIAGGRPWINAKQSSAIIRRELGSSQNESVGDIYTDYFKLDNNNKNSIILSMNNFSLDTFIYAIKWLHWEKNMGLTLPVESSVYQVNLPM